MPGKIHRRGPGIGVTVRPAACGFVWCGSEGVTCRADRTGQNGTSMGDVMGIDVSAISKVLQEAAETHHRVYRIVDGADPDWASWYADWLIRLSEVPKLLGTAPVHSELVYLLVKLDKDYTRDNPSEPWDRYYASRIAQHSWPSS